MKYNGQIILSAHRGDRKRYPENTIPAFESAIKLGVDMIETDVHMTEDKELIIMHDHSLMRTTGFDGLTSRMKLQEIKKLDAGSWFSEKFSNVEVPTVEEFIALIDRSNILINWELKDFPHEVGDDFAFETADKLIRLIKEHGLEDRSMINSFSDKVLEYVYEKYPNTFTIHGQGIHNCKRTKDVANIAEEKLYDWCCLYPNVKGDRPLDYPENFEYCQKYGILPCVCVPDELETYKKYIELGCRMFTSNDVVLANEILKKLHIR